MKDTLENVFEQEGPDLPLSLGKQCLGTSRTILIRSVTWLLLKLLSRLDAATAKEAKRCNVGNHLFG